MANNPINKKTSALTVNTKYSLPTVDGTANQVLTTNGAGTTSWQTFTTSKIVQIVNAPLTAWAKSTTTIPTDDTIPQNTEGTELMTLAITPKNVNNILLIEFSTFGYTGAATLISLALFQDTTAGALSAIWLLNDTSKAGSGLLRHVMVAGTTSATTFKIRFGNSSSTLEADINGTTSRYFGGVAATLFTITEFTP